MGWEKRGNKQVYYRKQRGEDGRVRSVYCGSGERGEAAEREDLERRSTRGVTEMRDLKKDENVQTVEKGEGTDFRTEKKETEPVVESRGPITSEELRRRAAGREHSPNLRAQARALVDYYLRRGPRDGALRKAGVSREEASRRGLQLTPPKYRT